MKKRAMKLLAIALVMPLFVGVMSCKNEADPEADKSFFTRFYDDASFNIAYTPLDAAQTTDGGYLILALKRTIDLAGQDVTPGRVYILKTNAFGDFISDEELDENLGQPAPALMNVGGKFYFFCMDTGNFSIQLMEVGEDGRIAQQLNVGGTYPLAAGVDGNNMMLLHFDPGARTTIMSVVATSGHVEKTKGFNIGAADGGPYAPEATIMDHINRQGRLMPFFVGKASNGLYFFNGIYNYTLSVVFTDLNANNPISVINGFQDDGGLSALRSVTGGKFAASRFNFGDNYIMPSVTLSGSALSSDGLAFPELTANAPVVIRSATIDGKETILFGSNTRGKQIALYGYDASTGALVGTRYLGFSNSFEVASMTPTLDNGLLVLGTTYIAGRFPRICLFKLSAEALGKSFQ